MPKSTVAAVSFIKRGVGGAVLGAFSGGIAGNRLAASMRSRQLWVVGQELYEPGGAIVGIGVGGLLGMLTALPTGVVYEFE